MRKIRWIHLSDLHLGNNSAVDTRLMRRKLPAYITSLSSTFDYMFCSGDIKEWNGDYTQAADYITSLGIASRTPLNHLFIVPGNHDVEIGGDDRTALIARLTDWKTDAYDSKEGLIAEADMELLRSGQTAFISFITQLLGADRAKKYAVPHFNITTEHFNILHLDSTITYGRGHDRDLVIGTGALMDALEQCDKSKPTIILTHYSFDFLTQSERNQVENLLLTYHVQLWFAGHEHENLIRWQRDKFMECQCGNLALQKGARSCFLTGELDLDTGDGKITVHAWYEGKDWEIYPFARIGSEDDRIYPFRLRLSWDSQLGNPGDLGMWTLHLSREAIRAKQANQEYIDELTIIDELIPEIVSNNTDAAENHSFAQLLCAAWSTNHPHRILIADGGMGKTTMQLKFCQDSAAPVLYISAERLAALGISIKNYCARVFFEGNVDIFERFVSKKYTTPTLILLIDGLNEVEPATERCFINEIKTLNLLDGIQFVLSSRSDFTCRYRMSSYRVLHLKPLSDEKIASVFSTSDWAEVKDQATLHHLLSNPMMVTMYKEISPIVKKYGSEECLEWAIPIKNATDLLHNYYVAQLAVLLHRDGMDGRKAQRAYQILFDILPAVAYKFETTHKINKKNADFRALLSAIVEEYEPDKCALAPIQEYFRDYELPTLKTGEVLDYLTEETHLLYKDSVFTSFPHQIYRDFLSAAWIVKETDADQIEQCWNSRGIPFPIMEHIRNLSGRYWEGLAKRVHDVGKNREDAFHLVGNLLDCFKYTGTSGCPDYSCLDLRGLQIPDVAQVSDVARFSDVAQLPAKRISLQGARLDHVSIGKSNARPPQYTHLRFSDDNAYLAAATGRKVWIFSLQMEEPPLIHSIDSEISRLNFVSDYLFVVVGSDKIHVYKRTADWFYVGVIMNSEGTYCSVLNNRLRSIILKDDVLHFYYNNREKRFNLSDCTEIFNQQRKHAWEKTVDGIDATFLKEKDSQRRNPNTGIIWTTTNGGLAAKATQDGDLIVYSGKEIQYILARGITLLKDGSISGDGKCAATLSYEVLNGHRKIQLWDLKLKFRIGEMRCPESIQKIHLSEDGSFILGETDKDTWTYDRITGTEHWYQEHFVSNQHGKKSTYGTRVLRKNNKNDLYLYDLRTGESEEVENPCKNARLACFMSDGTIAAVGNNACKVRFKNIRTGEYSEVNSQNSHIIGISSFKNVPFFAVATQDNMISIYHIGDGMQKRKIETTAGNYRMVVSPEDTVIASTNGNRLLQTFNYYEKVAGGKKMGWWYSNPYSAKDPEILGNVLDLAFNTENHELVVILANGQLVFCHEKYCRFHDAVEIITNFNVDAYEFTGCICEDAIREQIRQNGGNIV